MTGTHAPAAEVSKKVVLWVAMMSSFLTPFTSSSVNIALPSIAAEYSLDAVSLNWVASAYLLAAVTFLVPFGRLADIRGRKRILQIGVAIDCIASILCTLAPSGAWLIAFRALQGFGGAMIFGTSTAIVTSVYPARERGRALGFIGASVYMGSSAGPLIGGLVTEHVGWHGAFIINAMLGVVITALVLLRIPGEWAEAKGEKFDRVGSLLYSVAVLVLIYGFSVLPALWGFGMVAFALAGLSAFVLWELREPYPILNMVLFQKNRTFVFSIVTALINYSATFTAGLLLSLYLQYIGGYTPGHAGLILMTQPVMMTICSLITSGLSNRFEPRAIATAGMALTTLGLAMLALVGSEVNVPWIYASLFVLGSGFGFFSSPNTNAVMSSVERKFFGVAAGTLGTMRLTGQSLGLAVVLVLFSLYIGRVEITPANHSDFLSATKIAFSISAILAFIGIIFSAARGQAPK